MTIEASASPLTVDMRGGRLDLDDTRQSRLQAYRGHEKRATVVGDGNGFGDNGLGPGSIFCLILAYDPPRFRAGAAASTHFQRETHRSMAGDDRQRRDSLRERRHAHANAWRYAVAMA